MLLSRQPRPRRAVRSSCASPGIHRSRANPQKHFIVLRKQLIEIDDFQDLSRWRLAIDGSFHGAEMLTPIGAMCCDKDHKIKVEYSRLPRPAIEMIVVRPCGRKWISDRQSSR